LCCVDVCCPVGILSCHILVLFVYLPLYGVFVILSDRSIYLEVYLYGLPVFLLLYFPCPYVVPV
jgi:hypothetical protein